MLRTIISGEYYGAAHHNIRAAVGNKPLYLGAAHLNISAICAAAQHIICCYYAAAQHNICFY